MQAVRLAEREKRLLPRAGLQKQREKPESERTSWFRTRAARELPPKPEESAPFELKHLRAEIAEKTLAAEAGEAKHLPQPNQEKVPSNLAAKELPLKELRPLCSRLVSK